jgi:uncharacterized repeat protein (TIGR03847 family)
MPGTLYELDPVAFITTGCIGEPGHRVFYLQAQKSGEEVLTLLIEKQQVEALASGIEQFLKELQDKMPTLAEASGDYTARAMELKTPVDPAFRIGQLGLGYDADRDLLVIVAQEVLIEGRDPEEVAVARLFATRSQLRALGEYGQTLVKQGRPICPLCGQPMDPNGHFCPRSNGHAH